MQDLNQAGTYAEDSAKVWLNSATMCLRCVHLAGTSAEAALCRKEVHCEKSNRLIQLIMQDLNQIALTEKKRVHWLQIVGRRHCNSNQLFQ